MNKHLSMEDSKTKAKRKAWNKRYAVCLCGWTKPVKMGQIDNLDETREYKTSDFVVVCPGCYEKGSVLGKSFIRCD